MKAVSICTEAQTQEQLEQAIARHGGLNLCRSLASYPDTETLGRILRAWAPDMIFLDLRFPGVEQVNGYLAEEFPEIRRIAVHPAQLPEVFRRVLHLGMHELVCQPFKQPSFTEALERVITAVQTNPLRSKRTGRVLAYLPAKAGVGASTIAAQATWALAQDPEARVLLADFDIYSGIVSFLFNVDHEYSIRNALLHGDSLDEDVWRGLVKAVGNIDLLLSHPGTVDETRTTDRRIPELLSFAQRNYTVVQCDLPDSLDSNTLGVLHEADQIFLVTTPEVAALRLARLKAAALRSLDLNGRAALLVNRMAPRNGLTTADIERTVGLEVAGTFPCHYKSVATSIQDAKPAAALTKSVYEFAASALGWKGKASGIAKKFTMGSLPFRIRQTVTS